MAQTAHNEAWEKLLWFLVENDHNYENRIATHDPRLRDIDLSSAAKAVTRGYVASEPSHTNITLYGPHFFWIWATKEGAAYVNEKSSSLPIKERLFLDDIESFARIRGVDPRVIAPFLKNGYLDATENMVQIALEDILNVPFHKMDWGGEGNDLYTANLTVDGKRRPTAFLLKGNGLKNRTMEIKHCGKNGDQVIRLFRSPADLFVIQFVGNIAEAIIDHAHGENARLKTQGKKAQFLIIDGQDTARLLYAYDKLTLSSGA
jgi:hypothetical protein